MKNGTTAMRLLCLVLSMLMLFSLAACGEDQKGQSSVSGVGQNQPQANPEKDSVHKGLVFGEISNAGANPNNLTQCPGGIAFDKEYIYFTCTDKDGDKLARVKYDGSGYEVLPVAVYNNRNYSETRLFNLKDGWLYHYRCKGDYQAIEAYNTETGEIKTVTHVADPVVSLLVLDNYLYIAELPDDERVHVSIFNLDTNIREYRQDIYCWAKSRFIAFTTDGEYVYLSGNKFTSTHQNIILRLIPGAEPEEVSQITVYGNLWADCYSFGTNGHYAMSGTKDMTLYGKTYAGELVNTLQGVDSTQTYHLDFSYNYGSHFVLDENYLMLAAYASREALGVEYPEYGGEYACDIVMFPDMDFNNPQVIYTIPTLKFSVAFGVHENTFYLIETDENDKPTHLVVIDADGKVNKTAIR